MNEEPPSYSSSEHDPHVREPSSRCLYDRPNGHSYSYDICPSDLEAGTAPPPPRKWTKPLRDGFTTLFQALARKQWNMTATFEDMATAAEALLKLLVILMVIVAVVFAILYIICLVIYLARNLLA